MSPGLWARHRAFLLHLLDQAEAQAEAGKLEAADALMDDAQDRLADMRGALLDA